MKVSAIYTYLQDRFLKIIEEIIRVVRSHIRHFNERLSRGLMGQLSLVPPRMQFTFYFLHLSCNSCFPAVVSHMHVYCLQFNRLASVIQHQFINNRWSDGAYWTACLFLLIFRFWNFKLIISIVHTCACHVSDSRNVHLEIHWYDGDYRWRGHC